jgi:hypothetical protein
VEIQSEVVKPGDHKTVQAPILAYAVAVAVGALLGQFRHLHTRTGATEFDSAVFRFPLDA